MTAADYAEQIAELRHRAAELALQSAALDGRRCEAPASEGATVTDCHRCKRREAVGDAMSPRSLQAAIALCENARLSTLLASEHHRKRSRRAYAAQARADLALLRSMLVRLQLAALDEV